MNYCFLARPRNPYRAILNYTEAIIHTKLQKLCSDWQATVHPKMRVADILPLVKSGIRSDYYKYALQAHFDFIIVDNKYLPLFAVEFDGPCHINDTKQQARDHKKNQICKIFKFPLLRINFQHYESEYRYFDLLSYFIEIWFLEKLFLQEQEKGNIPWIEGFSPSYLHLSNSNKTYPFHLSYDAEEKIENLCDTKKIADFRASYYTAYNKTNNTCSVIAYIRLNGIYGVYYKLTAQNLFFLESTEVMYEAFAQVAICELYKRICLVLHNKLQPVLLSDIKNNIIEIKNKCHVTSSCILGGEI